jgi:hypothetical protein
MVPTAQVVIVWADSVAPDSQMMAFPVHFLQTPVAAQSLYPSMQVLHFPAPSPSSHPSEAVQVLSSFKMFPAVHLVQTVAESQAAQLDPQAVQADPSKKKLAEQVEQESAAEQEAHPAPQAIQAPSFKKNPALKAVTVWASEQSAALAWVHMVQWAKVVSPTLVG